jgi:predicted methyltransferase
MQNKRSAQAVFLPLCALAVAACANPSEGLREPAPGAPPAAAAPAPSGTPEKIKAALAGGHRSEKNRVRDPHRHPLETLSFFGLRDDMTVVELAPGGGWYTEILGPVLKEKGKLVVTSGDPNGPADAPGTKRAKDFQTFVGRPELFGKVQLAVFAPPDKVELGPPGSADMVVTFRNLHGWINNKSLDKVMAAALAVLKPGGILGVVEHRGKPGQDIKTGYVDQAEAIKMIEAVGFKLVETSEINANPKDTKDHPEGVWTLPPTLRLKEKDQEKYVAIGESDRMTLKFMKPAQ